ncbi:phage baseplate plug family protein [Achromobacter spanius]|uniref:phage baseplate plug family protein n=1 Tax=Achromobacter spanius TaxID=217203 RepID=UPI003D33BC62
MKRIPLQPVPSQTLSVVLSGQNCQISVYQKTTGIYLDLEVDNSPIVTTVLCHDRVRLVRSAYLGFFGDLTFVDTQGHADPQYENLGSRFVLAYLEALEL